MKIVLATGIYPPDIGGPATYAKALAEEFSKKGHDVTVVTYGRDGSEKRPSMKGRVVVVSKSGGPIARWMRYAFELRKVGADADAVIAFTSVSVGIPVALSRLKKPKKILRIGGEFFWERYTDGGGTKSLAEWYTSRFGFWRILNAFAMEGILRSFNHLVYSTDFQRSIHKGVYRHLPPSSVIENAVPTGTRVKHTMHTPLRMLFMGRFVHFKNLYELLEAMHPLDHTTLTVVGAGSMEKHLKEYVRAHNLRDRVHFLPPVHGEAKAKLFAEHDLLVLPSVTEISPNTALEASSCGLPVVLTSETGLSAALACGMLKAPMADSVQIVTAVHRAVLKYDELAAATPADRSWTKVTDEWMKLLASL